MLKPFPDGVIVTFAPAVKLTLSNNPFSPLTTCPGAIFAPVTPPFAMPSGEAVVPAPASVASRATALNKFSAGTFTPNGEAAVPFPVNVPSRATALNRFGAAMLKPFPDGVIVTLAPAVRLTLSNNPFRLLTTCPDAIFAPVTPPFAMPRGEAVVPFPASVASRSTALNRFNPEIFTPNGEPAVPFPVRVMLRNI